MPEWEVPAQYRVIYNRAINGGTRAARIKALCLHCQGFENGAKKMIRECTVTACPLHGVRPYQTKPPKDPDAPKGVFPRRKKEEVES